MDLYSCLRLIRRRSLVLVLCVALASGTAYVLTKDAPVEFEATARALVGPGFSGTDLRSGVLNSDALRTSSALVSTYRDFATSQTVFQTVIDELGLPLTPKDLDDKVSATASQTTRIINIRVRDADPDQAIAIATKIVEVVGRVHSAEQTSVAAQFAGYEMPRTATPRLPLSAQAVPLAFLGALALGVLLVFTIDQRAGTLDTAADLDAAVGAPCLGVVPLRSDAGHESSEQVLSTTDTLDNGAYRLVAVRLLARATAMDVRSVHLLDASPGTDTANAVAAKLGAAIGERLDGVVVGTTAARGIETEPKLAESRWATTGAGGLPLPDESARLAIVPGMITASTADSLALISQVDAVVLVVEKGTSTRGALDETLRELRLIDAKIIGSVFVERLPRQPQLAGDRQAESPRPVLSPMGTPSLSARQTATTPHVAPPHNG